MNILIIIFLALLLSAFFSGMEIAFVSANKLRIELDKKQHGLSSTILTLLTRKPEHYIATMLVGNNIALVVYGIMMSKLLLPLFELHIPSETGVLLIQTLISTLIILITAEFLPKTLFRINPNTALNIFSVPVFIFYIFLYPISWFSIIVSNFFMRFLLNKDTRKDRTKLVFGKPDLDNLMNEVDSKKDIQEQDGAEIKIFQNALEFSNAKVRDCMIPRTDITALEVKSPMEEFKQKFIETGFSKILVYEEKIDNIIGFISHKEFFKDIQDIRSRIVEVNFVPETMSASKLLQHFIEEHKSIAVVVDEFGGLSGMLTIEDIIEEITGEIEDEHDVTDLIERRLGEDHFLFSGRLEIDYLNEKYELNLPESDEYETLAGLIIFNSDKIPQPQEVCIIENFQFITLKVTERRIELIEIKISN